MKNTSKGIRSLAFRRRRPNRRSCSSGVVPIGTLKGKGSVEEKLRGFFNSLRRQVRILLVEVLQLLWCVGLERRLARQALEHDRSQRPEIRLGVVLQRHDDFRCHVLQIHRMSANFFQLPTTFTHHRRSTERRCHVSVLQEPRESKVGDFQRDVGWRRQALATIMRQQDVLWLQIPMDDSLGKQRLHRAS